MFCKLGLKFAQGIPSLKCVRSNKLLHIHKQTSDDTPARITVPHRMIEKINRIRAKRARAQRKFPKGPIIISASNPAFNYHVGQSYSEFKPELLASGGWKNRKSNGNYFTILATKGNPALNVPDDLSTFSSLGIIKPIEKQLAEYNIVKPTSVQVNTIPHMLKHKNVLVAAETGSGKTLAFLLPALQNIINFKEEFGHFFGNTSNTPLCLIVTPARELADQIHAVAEDICSPFSINCKLLVGGRGTQKILKHRPQQQVDILVATTGVLSKVLTNKIYDTSHLQHIILDEADTLLDDSFGAVTSRILSKLKIASEKANTVSDPNLDLPETVGTQLALVSATMPRGLERVLGRIVPLDTITTVTTSYLHRVMPHVSQKFVRIAGQKKPNLLVSHLKRNEQKKITSMVFANSASTATFVSHLLDDNKIPNILLHSQMSEAKRHERFENFQRGESRVLVSTDVASRGLDTCDVQHVVNYDFPNFISDYIHRVGRVGRVGSTKSAFCLSFIQKRWEVDVLWAVESAARGMAELHNVNANIKRKIEGRNRGILDTDDS